MTASDVIHAECPCGQVHQFASAHVGRIARCPTLNRRFRVPSHSGPIAFLVDAATERTVLEGRPEIPEQPSGLGGAIVRRARDLYQSHKEKMELYRATHCRCPHCKTENRNLSPDELKARKEATTLDRIHAAMLLQSSGATHALRAMLEAEPQRSPDFLRLANALAAMYPRDSEEKRLLDAMLLAVPR